MIKCWCFPSLGDLYPRASIGRRCRICHHMSKYGWRPAAQSMYVACPGGPAVWAELSVISARPGFIPVCLAIPCFLAKRPRDRIVGTPICRHSNRRHWVPAGEAARHSSGCILCFREGLTGSTAGVFSVSKLRGPLSHSGEG